MHFFNILSVSFLLVGAYAGILEEKGYTFKDLGNGVCTVTSGQRSENRQLQDKFKVNKADKSMTIIRLNIVGDEDPDQLSTSAIMAAVSRQYDLEPDNLNKVVMTVKKDYCLRRALRTYRWIYTDLHFKEKIDTTLTVPKTTLDLDRDVWWDLYHCKPFKDINRMLTINAFVNQISIKEDDETCLMSYFIGPYEVKDETTIHNSEDGEIHGNS